MLSLLILLQIQAAHVVHSQRGGNRFRGLLSDNGEINNFLLFDEIKPPSDRIHCSFRPNHNYRYKCGRFPRSCLPKLERVLDRSIKAFFPGLLRMDRLAREMSAVTRVIVILEHTEEWQLWHTYDFHCGCSLSRLLMLKSELTCLQIDVLKNQTVLFASYL